METEIFGYKLSLGPMGEGGGDKSTEPLLISAQSVSHAIPSRQSAVRQNPRAPLPPTNHEAEKEKNK